MITKKEHFPINLQNNSSEDSLKSMKFHFQYIFKQFCVTVFYEFVLEASSNLYIKFKRVDLVRNIHY